MKNKKFFFISVLITLILSSFANTVLANDIPWLEAAIRSHSECDMVEIKQDEFGYPSYSNFSDQCLKTLEANGIVFGRGGASLISPTTGKVYATDPDTMQEYTLEKLLEIGRISAEDYQVYAAARDAYQANNKLYEEVKTPDLTTADTAETVSNNQQLSEPSVSAVEAEDTTSVSDSSNGLTTSHSEIKVLPKTSDSTSMVAVLGAVMSVAGLAGLKKRLNQC